MKVFFGFLLGIVFSSFIFLIFLKLSSSPLIPPYYDKKAFTIPKDIVVQKNPPRSIRLPILMYHYVEYIKDINDVVKKKLDISPDVFESHLKVLRDEKYVTYFVKDVPDILSGKIAYAPKNAVLTFDDGYEDFYTVVFPLLKKYQMKATIFIISDFIGRKGFLNAYEIKDLIASGMVEIGSHTLDHVYLKSVPKSVAQKQIKESKGKLEDQFGISIYSFAYPYGAFTEEVVNMVKEAGYTAAVSVIPGVFQSNENLYFLSRIRPGVFTARTMTKVMESYKK